MANVTFAVRGNQFPALYSSNGPGAGLYANPGGLAFTQGTGTPTNFIGSGYLNGYPSSNTGGRALYYPGYKNISNGLPISILIRTALNDNANLQGIWALTSPALLPYYMYLFYGSGSWHVNISNATGTAILGNFAIGSFTPVAGAVHDIVVTSTGDTTTNGFKFYVDGTINGQTTLGSSITAGRQSMLGTIALGGIASDVAACSQWINEFVLWDGVIDPTNVALTSGNGSLSGPTRTAFVAATAFDATVSVDPGVANVTQGTAYEISGISLTGTNVNTDPGVANVTQGTAYAINSVAKTGTNVNTDPGIANVTIGVGYQINSVAKTGTNLSTDPGVTKVKSGTTYSINSVSKTGTDVNTDPGVANVLEGVAYEIENVPKVGTLHIPVSVDPGTDNVALGVEYEINDVDLVGTRNVVTNVLQSATLVGQKTTAILEADSCQC